MLPRATQVEIGRNTYELKHTWEKGTNLSIVTCFYVFSLWWIE